MAGITIIGSDNILYKSCMYNCYKYLINKTNLSVVSYRNLDANEDEDHKSMYLLPIGISELDYKNIVITAELIEKGNPIEVNGISKIHYQLKLISDNIDIIKDFIKNSKELYFKDIVEKKKIKNKINCYIWDEYWDNYNRKSFRPINTLCFSKNIHYKLLEDIKIFLSKDVEKEYTEYGIPYKYNILLEGYPGTGKSSIIHCLASELNMNIASISFDEKMNDLALIKAIKRLPAGTILCLEDIDVLFKKRKENEFNSSLTFSGLLNILDGPASINKQIIIMTTNYCCNLDSALIRPGRIDNIIHFDYADKEQIQLIYYKFFNKNNIDENVLLENFNKFYNNIKFLKTTSAILQAFFFTYRNDNILNHIEELKKTISKNNYDTNDSLYT
jgi:hypothetical protein